MLLGQIRLARPQDWVKNVFVLLPVPFALKAIHAAGGGTPSAVSFLLGLTGFCLINSAIYTLNDFCDAAADRLHPKKCKRPIAAGEVSKTAAVTQIVVLLTIGFALSVAAQRPSAVPIVLAYVAINVAYNLGAKHVTLLDVFLLSSGFVIRVMLGCALIGAPPSPWLLLCTATLSLFLGFAKRRADLTEELDLNHRPSLRGYSKGFLDQAVGICSGVALLSYALYCIEVKDILLPGREMASMPFVAYGILNYLRMVYVEGIGGSPVHVAYHSVSTQICAAGWIAAVTWSLGLW
ncbi:MAG: UbiA prenyltransferase family protein [Planctomycetaceae bacterium]|nr:UbiA prenyltransferase family protein [Planctomycetaceae bacterium]